MEESETGTELNNYPTDNCPVHSEEQWEQCRPSFQGVEYKYSVEPRISISQTALLQLHKMFRRLAVFLLVVANCLCVSDSFDKKLNEAREKGTITFPHFVMLDMYKTVEDMNSKVDKILAYTKICAGADAPSIFDILSGGSSSGFGRVRGGTSLSKEQNALLLSILQGASSNGFGSAFSTLVGQQTAPITFSLDNGYRTPLSPITPIGPISPPTFTYVAQQPQVVSTGSAGGSYVQPPQGYATAPGAGKK
ncbi:unnamed protein product [Caenorhabditis auriculariae]|uniref:Uncharacterized protein n=1 Tax=Caenorhabditis auriculariae TaxID=2777116 RepID=A0A8S1GUR0_9PELO|nr:unnamed protein product [Caenorhabditis auriculariae]